MCPLFNLQIAEQFFSHPKPKSRSLFKRGQTPRADAGRGALPLVSWRIGQLPGQCQDIPGHGLYDFRIDGVGGVGRLVKVRVDAAVDDGDRRDSCFLEGHMIAAGEKPIEVVNQGQSAINMEMVKWASVGLAQLGGIPKTIPIAMDCYKHTGMSGVRDVPAVTLRSTAAHRRNGDGSP